ncbi:MAG TPA: hypothetical protein VN903_10915 [Polyangia bacterium]|jgi:hypothetical protein|nr:hypothetical protein [Polyangia bacterium]
MAARTSHRRSTSKPRSTSTHAARPPADLPAFNTEWWSSWRRANALGWDYLNAVSGLMRLNLDVFSRATRFPFDIAASNSR